MSSRRTFDTGDTVKWMELVGIVVGVVPAGAHPLDHFPEGTAPYDRRLDLVPRDHLSYIVRVDPGRGHREILYRPPTDQLKKAKHS